MPEGVESRLAALGLALPDAPAPAANYVPYVVSLGLVFVAGQAPVLAGKYQGVGRVGAEVTLEAAQAAARLCGLNVLAQAKAAAGGDWSRIVRCVRLCGYVSSAPDFFKQQESPNTVKRALRYHDFGSGREGSRGQYVDIGKASDKAMGQNSCQPQ